MPPGDGKSKNDLDSKKTGSKIFFGIFIFFLIIITVYVSGVKGDFREDLKNIKNSFEIIKQKNLSIKQTKLQRVNFLKKQSFMNHSRKFAFSATHFIHTLSQLTPEGVDLTLLKMAPQNRNLRFNLTGMVSRSNHNLGQKHLNGFYLRLEALDEVIRISRSSQKAESPKGYSLFHFEGEIEIE
ncbi:MAG: hypothetical protein KAT17_03220 [Candidatus Aminicenantes bacterium]|nr:hypothetical protein [Candidatus Aminicenantes bacterium]